MGAAMGQPKTPENAARLSEERAKQARARYAPPQARKPFTSEEIFTALNDNEIGDAKLLASAMQERFVFDSKRGVFFRFEGGYWKKDLENECRPVAVNIFQEAYGAEAARQAAVANNPVADKETQDAARQRMERCNKRLERVKTLHRLENTLKLAASGLEGLAIPESAKG